MDFEINVVPDLLNTGLQIVATIILFAVLARFLYKPVNNLLTKRSDTIEADLAAARAGKVQADELKAEYEANLMEANNEAKGIVDTSRERGEELKQQMLEEAQLEVQEIKARASKDIVLEREEAQREMKGQIAEIAMLVASKVIDKNMDTEVQQSLVDQFIDEVGGSQWQN